MKVGVPKEIKNNESRVGITPAGVFEFTKRNHEVYIQSMAGEGSGFFDDEYKSAGAQIVNGIKEVYDIADMIVKVKEPVAEEYGLIKENQVVFTYFHFASSATLTNAMISSKAVCIAYETVEDKDGSLPLLTPMSEVAGRMAIQQGAILKNLLRAEACCLAGCRVLSPGKCLFLEQVLWDCRQQKWQQV